MKFNSFQLHYHKYILLKHLQILHFLQMEFKYLMLINKTIKYYSHERHLLVDLDTVDENLQL
jgi:hypothetical protein